MEQVELAIEAADFVPIPVLASAFDLMAARAVVSLCGDHAKHFAFVLIRENPRREIMNTTAGVHLRKLGIILDERVQDNYVSALNKGKTGPEHPEKLVSRSKLSSRKLPLTRGNNERRYRGYRSSPSRSARRAVAVVDQRKRGACAREAHEVVSR